jgi:hypothetical protein
MSTCRVFSSTVRNQHIEAPTFHSARLWIAILSSEGDVAVLIPHLRELALSSFGTLTVKNLLGLPLKIQQVSISVLTDAALLVVSASRMASDQTMGI